jgi:hypothetical protein
LRGAQDLSTGLLDHGLQKSINVFSKMLNSSAQIHSLLKGKSKTKTKENVFMHVSKKADKQQHTSTMRKTKAKLISLVPNLHFLFAFTIH